MNNSKIKAYCFPCKKSVAIRKNFTLIKRSLKNGNVVTILCGNCVGKKCGSKVCKIIANEKK